MKNSIIGKYIHALEVIGLKGEIGFTDKTIRMNDVTSAQASLIST